MEIEYSDRYEFLGVVFKGNLGIIRSGSMELKLQDFICFRKRALTKMRLEHPCAYVLSETPDIVFEIDGNKSRYLPKLMKIEHIKRECEQLNRYQRLELIKALLSAFQVEEMQERPRYFE
jgi:hypothetical protein